MRENIRVLILDDDELVRESIAAFVEDEGFIVETVSTAEDALVMMQSSHYDVCITDLTLPNMDGENLILLAHEVCPETRFIMHSGTAFTPSNELLQTGFTLEDVLSKPIIRLAILVGRIRKLAGEKGVAI